MSGTASWNPRSLPDRTGTVAVVTGANAGLGFWTSLQLAQSGATVILACRNPRRAEAAASAILARVPGASLQQLTLDTSSLTSVRAAGAELAVLPRLDVLIDNAGIVHTPKTRQTSVDGNELVLATNFLGHFALTALALPALRRTAAEHGHARVVTLGSLATMLVRFNGADLELSEGYDAWRAYAQSKIALQSFGFALDRRLVAEGSGVRSAVAHPGYSLSARSPRVPGINEPGTAKRLADNLQWPYAQGKDRGAWPIVRAALDPTLFDGEPGPRFVAPSGMTKGLPVLARPAAVTVDPAVASAVWREGEAATGVAFD